MRVLILFWHGIGDNILATPALRKYKNTTGNYVGWMMNVSHKGANTFADYPYVDAIHWCSDAWHCCGHDNISAGSKVAIAEAEQVRTAFGYDELIIVTHKGGPVHKIYKTAAQLGVTLTPDELHTEFKYDAGSLEAHYRNLKLPEHFAFVHNRTSSCDKDMPMEWCCAQLPDAGLPIVTPAMWDTDRVPLAFAADVMRRADYRILADSALYHVAHALDLPVHLAYFGRGQSVWDKVHPLHPVVERVVFALNT